MSRNTALLLLLSAGLALGPPQRARASGKPVPATTAQVVRPTPEPPLAPVVPPGAVQAPAAGTLFPIDPPAPAVSIRVRVAAAAAAGQDLEYRICVTNRSRAAAHHVLVRDPLPANAAFVRAAPEPAQREPELVWHLGTLPPCACRE